MKGFDRPALTQILREGADALSISLSAAQTARLIDYLALLYKWNAVFNLTAVRDPEQMVIQHLLDSLAAVPAFIGAKNVLDVGAGGGLPGMVLSIWAAEGQPEMRIAMIDAVQKKTAFLTQVKAELGLDKVSIFAGRVERLKVDAPFDVITSRAFADLSDFIACSSHLLAFDGQFIAMKGMTPDEEIRCLPRAWKVIKVQALQVPRLQAKRHLVFIARSGESSDPALRQQQ